MTGSKDGVVANLFWQYSQDLYSVAGVESSCLNWQNDYQANVNLLLFCCWSGEQRKQFTASEMATVGALIDSWDRQVVQQLRQLRQLLKTVNDADSVYAGIQDDLDAEAFRKQILELELIAERIVQDSLYQWWQELPDYIGADRNTAVIENLNGYLLSLDCEGIDTTHPIVRACACG